MENKDDFNDINVEDIGIALEENEVMTVELFESWLEQAFTIAG